MKNEFFDKIYEDKINKFEYTLENYSSFSQNIKIDLFLGTSYPFIISIFNEINNYTNTLINDYLENENNLRNDDLDDIQEYFDEKERLEKNLLIEFEKEYFSKIFKNNESNSNKNKMGEILWKDYIIYYLSKSNLKFTNRKVLNFFECLYNLFLSLNDNEKNNLQGDEEKLVFNLKNISKFILFIESYKDYLYSLIELISSIDLYINNYIEDFVFKISEMCFRIANRYNSYVNDIFFNLFESMVYCIINLKIKFDEISDQNFELFLNEIKILSHILMKFNIELSLTLKQILYLFDFVEVKEIFNKNGIELKKNLNAYLDLLKEENE